MKRGNISLARSLCADIARNNGEYVEDWDGNEYGSVDIAEILSAEVERLREKLNEIRQWYDTDGSVGALSQIMDDDV